MLLMLLALFVFCPAYLTGRGSLVIEREGIFLQFFQNTSWALTCGNYWSDEREKCFLLAFLLAFSLEISVFELFFITVG